MECDHHNIKYVFSFVLQTLNLKQISNSNWNPGLRFCSNELLHMQTSGPSCQCPPKLCIPVLRLFTKTSSSTLRHRSDCGFSQKCSRQKIKTQHTYSHYPRFILSRTGHWRCKILKYSRDYHKTIGKQATIFCSIIANVIYVNT